MNDRVFRHAHAHKLEDPERLKWLPPAEVLSRLHLAPGSRVADVGAGTGYFTFPLANAVGPNGHVFAVDLQQEMLNLLQQKLRQANAPTNITLHRAPASQLPLADKSVDVVFYANIWHELDDPDAAFGEARRISVPGSTIAILDWRSDKESPPGPPQDHRIAVETLANFLQTSGCHRLGCYNVGQYGYLITAALPQR